MQELHAMLQQGVLNLADLLADFAKCLLCLFDFWLAGLVSLREVSNVSQQVLIKLQLWRVMTSFTESTIATKSNIKEWFTYQIIFT